MSIRVIAGEFRGRILRTGVGRDVRPTGDRVRETVFNILAARAAFPCEAVADLCAGSGALGIEALSRGAQNAVFVENAATARAVIAANLETLALTDHAELRAEDALTWAAHAPADGFAIVFADPPYAAHLAAPLLETIAARKIVRPGGWCVLEHDRRDVLPPACGDCTRIAQRQFGETVVDVYSRDVTTALDQEVERS